MLAEICWSKSVEKCTRGESSSFLLVRALARVESRRTEPRKPTFEALEPARVPPNPLPRRHWRRCSSSGPGAPMSEPNSEGPSLRPWAAGCGPWVTGHMQEFDSRLASTPRHVHSLPGRAPRPRRPGAPSSMPQASPSSLWPTRFRSPQLPSAPWCEAWGSPCRSARPCSTGVSELGIAPRLVPNRPRTRPQSDPKSDPTSTPNHTPNDQESAPHRPRPGPKCTRIGSRSIPNRPKSITIRFGFGSGCPE